MLCLEASILMMWWMQMARNIYSYLIIIRYVSKYLIVGIDMKKMATEFKHTLK